jgi:methionine biosynthesis protein MetW
MELMTVGYDLVLEEIPENAKVLDLGCGDGSLLVLLQDKKKVKGFGVEISEEGVSLCVEKGLYCYQADIDDGLSDYKDDSFDYVILNQTIQNTKRPDYVINEVLRIGKKAIISFPNFAYISTRSYLMFKGTMPVNELLPYEWYESPNIHLLTISDMKKMAGSFSFDILSEKNFSYSKKGRSKIVKCFPNLLAQYGFFVIEKTREK